MSWTHLEDTKPKARKAHRCYLCDDPIAVGEAHIRRVGVFDDDFVANRMHLACEAATQKWDEMDWESFDPADFREHLADLAR